MPTYEYRCQECGHEMEAFQSITAGPLRKCPECGRNRLRRLIGTGAGVVFKGAGFWQTDYRSESYKKGAESEKKAAEPAKSEGKADGKGESKKGESKPAPAESKKAEKESKAG